MDETPVVTCFLRNRGEVLLLRRSDAVGSYPGLWGGVAGHVRDDRGRDRPPVDAARDEVAEETGLAGDATLVRAGDPFPVVDDERATRWLVHPFLFDSESRRVATNDETTAYAWVPPTEILRRPTVPALWSSYDRVRPRVATIAADETSGSASLSLRALETLRDEAALAVAGDPDGGPCRREVRGEGWAAFGRLAEDLIGARPSMAVVAARVDRAMWTASDDRSVSAVESAASAGIDRAVRVDREAALAASAHLPDRIATLSRSGTVWATIRSSDPEAVLVAESRPGTEGITVAEELGAAGVPSVWVTTDAAFPAQLDRWDAGALVVGADRVLPDGRVLNKVGTRAAALAAPEGCPVYVVAASDKVAGDHAVDYRERPATDVYDGPVDLEVANPTFDLTPTEAVTAVVTESGPSSTAVLAAIAETRRTHAGWRDEG